jgi:asparagine synthase (glutamine-hydrolysing)
VAAAFGTDSHEIILRPDVIDVLPRVVWHMDEPVADPAAISAYLICREARKTLTVMLNGQGADEIFGGYPRHRAVRYADYYNRLPGPLRRHLVPRVLGSLRAAGPGGLTTVVRNAKKLTGSAGLPFQERYLGYLTHFQRAQKLELYQPDLRRELETADADEAHRAHLARASGRDPLWQMCYLDLKTFLPSLNLTYTDKMAMAHSIEVRVPFLDPPLVEAAFRMPDDLKIRGRQSKYVLKQACAGLLPQAVLNRRKAGFTAPIRSWLHKDLKGLVDDWLSCQAVARRGLFSPPAVERLVREHREGREDNAWKIFQLITLELWARTFLDADGSSPTTI